MATTVVILEMQAKPEAVDGLKAGLKELLPDTRAYDGCQGVDIYQDRDDPGHLVFYERWDSKEHYQKYLNWRTETGAMEQLGKALTGPPSIKYFDRVDA